MRKDLLRRPRKWLPDLGKLAKAGDGGHHFVEHLHRRRLRPQHVVPALLFREPLVDSANAI